MAKQMHAFEQAFSFTPLLSKTFSFLQDKAVLEYLMKWSMLGRISAQCYSFDQSFYPYNSQDFALRFFRDPNVLATLRKTEAVDCRVSLDNPVMSVDVEVVPCSSVSMALFDPIYSCGILSNTGKILTCFNAAAVWGDDYYKLTNELTKMLQEPDSEHYYVVGQEERGEFLFRLFRHLCLGGELCQHEDSIEPYVSTTRHIYKDLISVRKDPKTKEITVISMVLKVCAYDECGQCFPGRGDVEQTFAYLVVDPFKRHVCLFYHCYGIGTFTLGL